MKILAGIILSLVVGLALTGWQLKRSWSTTTQTRLELAEVSTALRSANTQNQALLFRLEAFDVALVALNSSVQKNQTELTDRLADIRTVAEEPSDDPKSFVCLDLPVPVQLDRRLREPDVSER